MPTTTAPTLADALMSAFPASEDSISFEHAGSDMQSTFRVCRTCGALVLSSMTNTHVRAVHNPA